MATHCLSLRDIAGHGKGARNMQELLTPDDVCTRWDITRRTLNRWLASGWIPGTREPIPYMRVGKHLRFTESQVEHIETRMVRTARHVRRRAS